MQHYHQLDKEGLLLINFKKIFATAQLKILNDCHDYQLTKKGNFNYKNTDVKRIVLHHVLHEICEEVIRPNYRCKPVIIFRPFTRTDTFEILDYSALPELNKLMLTIICQIKKLLPVQIVIMADKISFQDLKEKLDKKDGETIELIHKILCSMNPTNMSFKKVKAFATKNKLTFLSQQYFDMLRTKQIFF